MKLNVVSKTGKEATIAILNERDFFGEGCLSGQPHRLCSATDMTDCSVMMSVDDRRRLVRFPRELEVLNAASIEDETGDVVVRIARESDRADIADKNVPHGRPKYIGLVLEAY